MMVLLCIVSLKLHVAIRWFVLISQLQIGLIEAIEVYLDDFSASEYKELAIHIAFEAGEFFRIRRTAIVKLLTRILAGGFPDK